MCVLTGDQFELFLVIVLVLLFVIGCLPHIGIRDFVSDFLDWGGRVDSSIFFGIFTFNVRKSDVRWMEGSRAGCYAKM